MNTNDFVKFIKSSYKNRATTKTIRELYIKEQDNTDVNFKVVDRLIVKVYSLVALTKIKKTIN